MSDASSDTAVCKLSGVPDDAPPRSRDCFECAEPIPVERERSSFCSDRCRYRRQKRRRREHIEMTVEATDATFELHVEHARIGFVWGVACDPQVARLAGGCTTAETSATSHSSSARGHSRHRGWYALSMNRSTAATTVNLRISASSGRLDPAVVSRVTSAVVDALVPCSRYEPAPGAAALQRPLPPTETAA